MRRMFTREELKSSFKLVEAIDAQNDPTHEAGIYKTKTKFTKNKTYLISFFDESNARYVSALLDTHTPIDPTYNTREVCDYIHINDTSENLVLCEVYIDPDDEEAPEYSYKINLYSLAEPNGHIDFYGHRLYIFEL